MKPGPKATLAIVIGAALLAPGAVAQQRDTQPPPEQTPPRETEPSLAERLRDELVRRAREAARAEEERRAREAAAGRDATGAQTQPGAGPTPGRTTPPPVVGQPLDRATPPPVTQPPSRDPPPPGPTGGPPPGTPGAGPSTIPAAQIGPATQPGRRFGRPNWAAAVADSRRRPGERAFLAGGGKLDMAAVDRTRLPILTPTDPSLVGGARFYSFGDYYSLNLDQPGLTIELTGTRVVGPTPQGLTRLPTAGPERVSVQRTVDGQLLSFTRYDLLYTVEVRCDAPRDARCRTDALAREVYAKTQGVILGRSARVEAGLEARR